MNSIPVTLLLLLTAVTSPWLLTPATAGSLPASLKLVRGLPLKGVDLDGLRARDMARAKASLHRRFLSEGVVDFPVEGSSSPFVAGLYYTSVRLGNPAKEFYVQIDTGSDVLWVNCNGCTGCPTSSQLDIQLKSFDPKSSSTASLLSCSDQMCTNAMQTGEGMCSFSGSSSQCAYSFQYGDGSATSGYYVSDTLHFNTVAKNDQVANSSAKVIFGY